MATEAYSFDEGFFISPKSYAEIAIARLKEAVALVKLDTLNQQNVAQKGELDEVMFNIETGVGIPDVINATSEVAEVEQEYRELINFVEDANPTPNIIRLD